MILDNFMKWGLKGEFKFVDDDPPIAKPAEVKMIGDKNVRAEVKALYIGKLGLPADGYNLVDSLYSK